MNIRLLDPLKPGRPALRRQLSREDIGNQGRVLLSDFIYNRLQQDHVQHVPAVEELQEPGTPLGPPIEHAQEISMALMCIADQLDQDPRIQRIIDRVPPDALTPDMFFKVANDLFDGNISWGRVVTLFYFGYKMVSKALDRVPLIKAIINWVINFLVDKVAPWIIERGGWESIVEYFGTPSWQMVGILTAGFATAGAVVAYNAWR